MRSVPTNRRFRQLKQCKSGALISLQACCDYLHPTTECIAPIRMDQIPSISLLSLEQRRQKQLLSIMHGQALKGNSRVVTNVNTRRQVKYVFKTENKMGRKYQHSPFFLGTRLWDSLDKETQDLPCQISTLYKKYSPLL